MQKKLKTIVSLSVLGAVMPLVGLPVTWRVWISAGLALLVAVIAYVLMRQVASDDNNESTVNHTTQNDDVARSETQQTEVSHTSEEES